MSRSIALRLLGLMATTLAATAAGQVMSPTEPAIETNVQYLSGHGTDDAVEWDFLCTGGRRSGEWSKIHVPSCWEQEGFGTYQYGLSARGKKAQPPASEEGKYRFRFAVPAGWQGRVVRIVFDGAMTDAAVMINGQSAGPTHQGAFYRFKYDISRLLKYGQDNLLEATVAKESTNPSVNAAERRGDYWNFGGIFRPVYLEALPAHFIDRVAIDAAADGAFKADIVVPNPGPHTRVEAQIVDASGASIGRTFGESLVGREHTVTVHTKIEAPQTWTAEEPNLYRVYLMLFVDGKPQHVVTQRFGFRTFEVRAGDGLYLNGRRILLKGINRHSFWPETGRALSRARNFADVRLIKAMNMNAVRMSHYPPDVDFLEACDELGLYVLDELAGWHGHYDTATGQELVAEMVQRDVNHPSILFWDNGNETGWNTALDGEFAKWDPQQRRVLHPWEKFSDVQTAHYRNYPETEAFLAKPDIFMPTEFLHGLYDGGQGAGIADFWELMRQAPHAGGGFLWSFADEGVARTDENGRIDNQGNWAPDGIVGPHHEHEGSFNTVREVWSPIQITGPATLSAGFDGRFTVENRFDFSSLDQCAFEWMTASFPAAADDKSGHVPVATGSLRGPTVPPHASGMLQIPLPDSWRMADVLYVTAKGPDGEVVWKWSWPIRSQPVRLGDDTPGAGQPRVSETANELVATNGALELRFSKQNGELLGVVSGGRIVSLGHGPQVIAERRGDRRRDGTVEPKVEKGLDRRYEDVSGPSRLERITAHVAGGTVLVEAAYSGALQHTRWQIAANGEVRLDYDYKYPDFVDLIGVKFDYPETAMKSIRWLGYGPYRVWENRTQGTTFDVWQNGYNDPIPGETYAYPEFKGYFRGWRWADFATTEGHLRIASDSPELYLGVFTPRDGADELLYHFAPTGLSFLDVIPPVRNKVSATDLCGPHAQPQRLAGVQHRTVRFRFDAK